MREWRYSSTTIPDIDDRMINEYGAVGGMKICGEREVPEKTQHQCHFFHHKSYVTWDRIRISKTGRRGLAV
jgi:hypothetical protein